MGGTLPNPDYGNYSRHGYSETVWMEYNPKNISYESLLDLFWISHDPTFEAPVAYRSLIWPYSYQLSIAEHSLAHMANVTKPPQVIRTKIHNATDFVFWPAEAYHQHYNWKAGELCPPDQHQPAPEACPDNTTSTTTTAAADHHHTSTDRSNMRTHTRLPSIPPASHMRRCLSQRR